MLKERPFKFPQDKGIRVIVDTDCNNECDDQYCVAHMLMTPKFDVRGIIAEHYGDRFEKDSQQKSYDEIQNIVRLMGLGGEVSIFHGAPAALADTCTPVESEGARFIIEEAMRDDPRPLFVCNLGAVTNLASAYLMNPEIAGRLTVIWIGGQAYPQGGGEFNLNNDVNAARVLFRSDLTLWQVPAQVYSTVRVSFFELLNKVYPCGAIGKYLVENTMRVGNLLLEGTAQGDYTKCRLGFMLSKLPVEEAATAYSGDSWILGDSPCVALMLNNGLGAYHMEDAPGNVNDNGTYDHTQKSSRKIRVYDSIDYRFILHDMFEKLKFYFGE